MTTTKTLRLSERAHERAAELAALRGETMTAAVTEAIEEAYQKAFWASAKLQVEAYQRDNPEGWAEYRREALEWDSFGSDLGDDDIPETIESTSEATA